MSDADSGGIQQADNDGIDNFGLLIFLGRIDHIVLDLHLFWKVHRGELKQPFGPPKTDQLPGDKVTDSLVLL